MACSPFYAAEIFLSATQEQYFSNLLDAALADFGLLQFDANMADLEAMLASAKPLNFAWLCPNCKTLQSD